MPDKFQEMNDSEIQAKCREICRQLPTAAAMMNRIHEWSGCIPAIVVCDNGYDRMFMGMIFGPNGNVISF